MSPLRLNGSTSGYSQIDAPAVAGDQTFTLPGTGGTLDRLNRAGNILQVVSATKTDNFTTTSTTFTDVAGLSVSITPTSASSKVIVFVALYISHPGSSVCAFRLMRDSTAISVNTANTASADSGGFYAQDATLGNAGVGTSVVFLDSPASASALTYKVQFKAAVSGTAALNTRSNATNYGGVSSITVMEVAA